MYKQKDKILRMGYYFEVMPRPRRTFFGDKLRTLRLQKGLTQTELGNKVGLSRRMIVHYEKHATRPPADKVMALAKALGLRVDELVKEKGHTNTTEVDPKFARRLERAKRLPKPDQGILAGIIDSFLHKNGLTKTRTSTSTKG
jgi:transcriptional regulator with XRE-family HTH domain